MTKLASVCAVSILLAGCTAARKPVTAPAYGLARDHSYIDVEPGSRLRVVTPLLKSGGYRVRAAQDGPGATGPGGPTVQMRVDSDFLGYELAYYAFDAKGRVRLLSVEATVQGNKEPRTQPVAKLFGWPADARFLRLVFLTRASEADHDMAVLTARRYEDLDASTAKLTASPEEACRQNRYCSWIPGGIAVSVERLDSTSGKWAPADRGGRPPR